MKTKTIANKKGKELMKNIEKGATTKGKEETKTIEEKKEEVKTALEDGLKKATKESGLKEGLPKSKDTKEDKKEKPVEKKQEKKKPIQKKPKKTFTEAVVNGKSIPVSAKYAVAICKFIKNKKIDNAISYLEQVIAKKKAVPMKGEIPHKKGKGMMSGRYPIRAAKHFINLLKSLSANSNVNEIEEPIITEAIANTASRPFGRFGRIRRKRTHIRLVAKSKKKTKEKKKK